MLEQRLHILIVEDNPDDVLLLREAFLEIDEERFSRPWLRTCQCDWASNLDEAISLLREKPFDAALLDLSIPGSLESSAFDILRLIDSFLPVVILAEAGDEARALALIRRGAQDFLVKSDLDRDPLARAIRCAVERTRYDRARMTMAPLCDNVGVENRPGRVV